MANNWVTDFLFVPVVAHFTLTLSRDFVVNKKGYIYPLSYLVAIALYSAFAFEIVAPLFSSKATADIWDAAAYLLGSLFYYYIHQQKDYRFFPRSV